MASPNFDYQGALDAGYSEDEIKNFISQSKPEVKNGEQNNSNFDISGALEAGYSEDEIQQFLSSQKPERSPVEQAARVPFQYGLGRAQAAALPYEIAVMGVGNTSSQVARTQQNIVEDIENLLAKKAYGEWSEKDEEELNELRELGTNPKKIAEEITHDPIDLSIPGLVERGTGISTHPENWLEKAANWAGFIKTPNKISLSTSGLSTKDAIKAIAPSGSEALRGVGAGAALEMAEDGEFGPIGTMAAAIVGDLAGGGVSGIVKGAVKFLSNPKKYLSEVAASFTPKEKISLQKEIIKDFREAGIQADLGTITDNNLVKWTQSRLAQSGLTGKALDDFRKGITTQIKEEYKALAESLGEAQHASAHEAGLVAKEAMKTIRDADLASTRELYNNATNLLKENSFVESTNLANAIRNLEKELKPGAIKSTEQQTVLNTLEKIKKDLYTEKGTLKLAKVKDLMNDKIALNDIINYEVQGGAKQLLKGIVGELDRAIISHGKQNIPFVKNYVTANKKFSKHAKTFRNKKTTQMLNAEDPSQLINQMNTVQGIQNIKKILSKTPQGEKILGDLQRYKLDKIVGDNLVDSTTQQVKLGTFSKLLEKGKNKEIVKEMLGAESLKRLERLQKNAGKLAEAANKFYNASQSGVVAADAAIMAKALSDIGFLLIGNPWPLAKTVGGVLGAKKLSHLLADPEFLKLTEDVVLASEKGSQEQLIFAIEKLKPFILKTKEIERENQSQS